MHKTNGCIKTRLTVFQYLQAPPHPRTHPHRLLPPHHNLHRRTYRTHRNQSQHQICPELPAKP